MNFLADLFSQGYQYKSLDAYRSAMSLVHDKVDVGQHPLVSRLLKGAFHQRPPQPRHTRTWDVSMYIWLQRISGPWGPNDRLPLQDLSHKLAMLMAFTRPSRSADLANLDITRRTYSQEGVPFLPTALSKQCRQQKHGTELFFSRYTHDDLLCPVAAWHGINGIRIAYQPIEREPLNAFSWGD